MTVPVYDYVLMTEPLTADQLASIGWAGRQGLGDLANQFHYSRLTADDRDPVGRVRRHLPRGRPAAPAPRGPAREPRAAGLALPRDLPAARGRPLHPPLGRRHRHLHAVRRVLRHDARRPGRPRRRLHRARRRRDPLRRRGAARPARRSADRAHRAADGARGPLPFPPEPLASAGINLTRWSLDRADHREGRRNVLPARARPGRAGVRLLSAGCGLCGSGCPHRGVSVGPDVPAARASVAVSREPDRRRSGARGR